MFVAVTGARAQMAGQLTTVTKVAEQALGALKVVEGSVDGVPSMKVTVWVNGISSQADTQGHYRVLIPNEPVTSLVAFQAGTNVVVTAQCREGERVLRYNGMNGDPTAIRDLLHPRGFVGSQPDPRAIRDLLHPF